MLTWARRFASKYCGGIGHSFQNTKDESLVVNIATSSHYKIVHQDSSLGGGAGCARGGAGCGGGGAGLGGG